MIDYEQKSDSKNYKSPVRKLFNFFRKSRDNWKIKYLNTKYNLKLLQNQIHSMKKRIAELKNKVKELEKTLEHTEEKKDLKSDTIEKKFDMIPVRHTYSIGHIFLFLKFVFEGCISFRGASRIFHIISSYFELNHRTPSWYSGRLWILRLGYFKLERAKDHADDWIWIVDHTVQLGSEKCLVILGIRQSLLPSGELHLNYENVETITMLPVTKSNGDIVYQQLTETIQKTGVPREIVADYGSDIKSGINRFCQEHKHTIYIYDIKHKTASILKREFQEDRAWKEFSKKAAQTGKKVQQTNLSGFAPPNQRSKARYMNIDTLIEWGQNMLCYLEHKTINRCEEYDSAKIEEKLGWIREYRDLLSDWEKLIQTVKTAENHIKSNGIYRNVYIDLKVELDKCPGTKTVDRVRKELISFTKEQSQGVTGDEKLLGSSEVIESVFGKFKMLERDQAKSGFTSLLLALPALISKTTTNIIQQAMEMVPTKKISEWYKENIGKSIQSKRKEILKTATS